MVIMKIKLNTLRKLLSVVNSLDGDHIIIAGDFNIIIDRNLDRINKQKNNNR